MSKKVLLYTLVAALGGGLFGFDTAVINGALPFFTNFFNLSDSMQGWAVSSALLGGILGAATIGKPSDTYGRCKTLIAMGLLFLISAIGTGLANDFTLFVIFRFIGGVAVGGASVTSPVYIAEIAPAKYRGRLTATFQLAIVLGILLAFFSDYLLLDTGENNWRWMFITEAIPATMFVVALLFVKETPRWLMKEGRVEEAREVMLQLNENRVETDRDIEAIEHQLKEDRSSEKVSLFRRRNFKSILIAIFCGMFNQFTGIAIVMYYATDIFRSVGFDTDSAIEQTVYVGLTNLIFTFIGMSLIDKIGRKRLLIIGTVGMAISLTLFAYAYLSSTVNPTLMLLSLMAFIGSFASSQGVVVWVLLAEIFPTNVRSSGVAVGSFSHWIFNGTISFLFPIIKGSSESGAGYFFAFFALMTTVSIIFFQRNLYETKGRSLEQISEEQAN